MLCLQFDRIQIGLERARGIGDESSVHNRIDEFQKRRRPGFELPFGAVQMGEA